MSSYSELIKNFENIRKELEYVERICENVGNISLSGNGNILTQLTQALNGSNA